MRRMLLLEKVFIRVKTNHMSSLGSQLQRHFIFSFLVVTFLTSSALPDADAVAAVENPLAQQLIIQQLENIKKQTGIGAVAYALVENNEIVATGGIGEYSIENSRPVTEDSLFRIGSITKTFTSLAVMHLVEQGKLQLDQTVKTLIPDVPLHNPWPKTPVTLAMLLEHTAGLQDLTREEFDYPEPLSLKAALNINAESKQVRWPPGYHYSYTNLGAGYVGRIIENITKENYDEWFEQEILASLEMRDSQLRWTKQLEQSLITGYDADLKTKIPYWHTLFRPFGGLNTTARDMAKFLLIFTSEPESNKSMPNKKFISASALKRMETTTTSLAAKAGLKTGYGLGIRNTTFNGHRLYRHGGDGDGYLSEFAYSKKSHRAYFIVINAFRHDILDDFTALLNNWLIEELQVSPAIGVATSQPHVKPLPLVGKYREVTTRFPFHAGTQAEILLIKHSDNEIFKCDSTINKITNKCTKILPVTKSYFVPKKNRMHPWRLSKHRMETYIYRQTLVIIRR